MSEPPFGFTGGSSDDPPAGDNPFNALFAAMGGPGADLGSVLHRLGDLFSWRGGPVNWDLARQVAQQTVGTADHQPDTTEQTTVAEAVRLAELWLDPLTTLPAGATAAEAWGRQQWIDATQPAWAELTDPVARKVVAAMGQAVPGELAAQQAAAPLLGMLGQVGGVLFGAQLGQALGTLSGEVVGSTDIGLPLGPRGHAALLPAGVSAFSDGLQVPLDEVRLFLALREVAHHRLFVHVPWLRAHLFGAVAAYADGIRVDTEALESAMHDLDPNDPESLQRALSGDSDTGLLVLQPTPEQETALARLETALALVEGWVDEVVAGAASEHLPKSAALREAVRRRRAVGGPAEQTFATLVGLELRPRRLREAASLWAALAHARGIDGRDTIWSHPDLLPASDDLNDPEAFLARDEGDPPGLADL
ncbi:MAG: zinc-dependent metalloprotease [Actinomycetes bacterium]